MSRRLLALNLLLAVVGGLLAVGLARELPGARPLPAPPALRAVAAAKAAPTAGPSPSTPTAHGAIAAKNLFSPNRSEAAAPVVAAGPKPVLHGVVMDGPKSRAYLEDPALKRTFGYLVGDTIGGGRVESIGPDRVVIARPDGLVEVLLQDPSKPKPAPAATPTPTGAAPASAAPPPAGAQPVQAVGPPAPPPARVPPAAIPPSRSNDR